jgi:SPP1 family predicted phage head-tail adaptor
MPGAGELDRRITIERATTVVDEFNEPIESWAPFITVWARRADSSDVVKTEVLGAEQVGSFLLSHFVIRSSSQAKTVTSNDRINYDGHIWNIKGTKETSEGRNRFIEISAVRANN